MSGFSKNVIPRRIHKERSQPSTRLSKHGLLEKKRDYKLRAKDHNLKKRRLQLLREKARFRNPDEFYHAMINMSTSHGVVHRRVDAALQNATPIANRSADQRLLAETQDSSYVAHKLDVARAKVRALSNSLQFVNAAHSQSSLSRTNSRRLFADDDDDADAVQQLAQSRQHQQHQQQKQQKQQDAAHVRRNKAYKRLQQHTERAAKLSTVYNDMTSEKHLLRKGRRSLVRPSDPTTGAPPVFRWRTQRSR